MLRCDVLHSRAALEHLNFSKLTCSKYKTLGTQRKGIKRIGMGEKPLFAKTFSPTKRFN